jgi:hypothetical protein
VTTRLFAATIIIAPRDRHLDAVKIKSGSQPSTATTVPYRRKMAIIFRNLAPDDPEECLFVFEMRLPVLLVAATTGLFALQPQRAIAEWWSRAPADFEECADAAEKSPTKEAKTAALADCNSKFAARRKAGGGYTYYDFMQNRSFDIAGPNPTPDEQKYIDRQYTLYLEKQRQDNAVAAFMSRPQPEPQPAALRDVPPRPVIEPERVPIPLQRPRQAVLNEVRSRGKGEPCAKEPGKDTFSCSFPVLSEKLSELKKLFTNPAPPTVKPNKKG